MTRSIGWGSLVWKLFLQNIHFPPWRLPLSAGDIIAGVKERDTCHLSDVMCHTLYYSTLLNTQLLCTILYCTALYCTVLHCTALHCTVSLANYGGNISKIISRFITPQIIYFNKKSRIREISTLSTDADSRTDTNLKRLRDLSYFFLF